jgi:hypothetical protein
MKWKALRAVGPLLVLVMGCIRVPPKTVALDRFDYGQAIAAPLVTISAGK